MGNANGAPAGAQATGTLGNTIAPWQGSTPNSGGIAPLPNQAQGMAKPAYQPGQDYWAQKNAALNPTGASQFNYNVNKMAPGWWNGAQNQGANGVVSQYGGPISASSLTPQDQAFMANAGRFMGGGFDPRNIVNGSADQASQLLGGDTYKGMAGFQKNPQQAMQGVSPQVLQAMSQMASQNPELQARWNQLTGGGQNPQPAMGVRTIANQGGMTPFNATTGGNMSNTGNQPGYLGPPIQPQNPPPGMVLDPTRTGGVRPWDAPGFDPTHGGPFYMPAPGNQPRYLGPPVQAPQPVSPGVQPPGIQPPWAWGGNNQLPWMQGS